jgi:hypothetical protein
MIAGTAPSQAASTPDSNSPSWLEVLMKIEFTALTRPRRRGQVLPFAMAKDKT